MEWDQTGNRTLRSGRIIRQPIDDFEFSDGYLIGPYLHGDLRSGRIDPQEKVLTIEEREEIAVEMIEAWQQWARRESS